MMACPLTVPPALEADMHACAQTEPLPIEAGDAEWVADLFETLREGDLEVVAGRLEDLVRVMRGAAKARHMLADVDPALLREGLMVASRRTGGSR